MEYNGIRTGEMPRTGFIPSHIDILCDHLEQKGVAVALDYQQSIAELVTVVVT
jgi:hypothetical protein